MDLPEKKPKDIKSLLLNAYFSNSLLVPIVYLLLTELLHSRLVLVCVFCRTFGLDSDSALNLYITTLLLQENADNEHYEVGARDSGLAEGGEDAEVGHEDVLEHVLRIVPRLSSTADLVVSLHTALTKVRLSHNMQVTDKQLNTAKTKNVFT